MLSSYRPESHMTYISERSTRARESSYGFVRLNFLSYSLQRLGPHTPGATTSKVVGFLKMIMYARPTNSTLKMFFILVFINDNYCQCFYINTIYLPMDQYQNILHTESEVYDN